jgi:Ca2+-binding EF-hand superfamily protein
MLHESETATAASVLEGFDADKDGHISLQELLDHVGDNKDLHAAFAGWQDGFKEADANSDGKLNLEEVTTLLSHVSRQNQHQLVEESEASLAQTILDGFDTDKNEKVSLQELLDHIGDESKLHASFHNWRDGFKEADADVDGELTAQELTDLLSHVSRQNQQELVHESEAETAAAVLDGFDTDKNGQISLQELLDHVGDKKDLHAAFQGWQEGFKASDADENGELNLEELTTLLSRVSRQNQHELVAGSEHETAGAIMDGMDTDKDGLLSMQELMDRIGDESNLHAAFKGWREGFTEADVDNDGHLNVEELTHLLSHISRGNQQDLVHESASNSALQVLDGFDTDRDGKISLQELKDHVGDKEVHAAFKGWETGFEGADSDKDGLLDVDELTTLIKHVSRDDQHEMVHESEASTAASVLEGLDTNKNGKISLEELIEHVGDESNLHASFKGWQDGFKDADRDMDGELTVHELTALLMRVSRNNQREIVHESEDSQAAAILDGFDTNKDGEISLKELLDHMGANAEVAAAFKGWEEGFKEADGDNNGKLNVEELSALLSRVSSKGQHKMVEESEQSTTGTVLDGFDRDKDGEISIQELLGHVGDNKDLEAAFKGWEKGFAEADADGNGKLSADELNGLISHASRKDKKKLVKSSEDEKAKRVMEGFDTDQDGKVSMKELMDHVGGGDVDAAFEGWDQGFKQADLDHDGHLTLEELSSLISHVSGADQRELVEESEKQANAMVSSLDTDKDGKISVEELVKSIGAPKHMQKIYEKTFRSADADGDGQLDAKELALFFQQNPSQMKKHDEM